MDASKEQLTLGSKSFKDLQQVCIHVECGHIKAHHYVNGPYEDGSHCAMCSTKEKICPGFKASE